jgi:hypothetical protein
MENETFLDIQMNQAIECLRGYNTDILNELLKYLDKHDYDKDIRIYFLNAFTAIYDTYPILVWREKGVTYPDAFAKHNLEILNSIDEIDFVRDINNDTNFSDSIEQIDNKNLIIGYQKDKDGHYVITDSNPSHMYIKNGYATKCGKDVHILFDDVSRYEDSRIHGLLFHELTHIEQVGFNLYWYIMNRYYFDKMLVEGHAIKTARQVKMPGSDGADIPFVFNEQTKQFEMYKHIEYKVYSYLYYKFEVLLGKNFMNEWAKNSGEHYMYLAYNKINKKYGDGTFERLYRDVQLILTTLRLYIGDKNTPHEEIKNVEEFNFQTDIRDTRSIEQDYDNIKAILDNEEKLKKAYLKEKYYKIESKKYAAMLKDESSIKRIEQEINDFTIDVYKERQENILKHLKKAKEVYKSVLLFNMTTNIDREVYNHILTNPNDLNNIVADLESLMIDSISIESDDKESILKDYDYNVFSNKFYCEPMTNVNDRWSILTKKDEQGELSEGTKRLLKKLFK